MNGVTKERFTDDLDLQEIVCFNIFQIGELAKGLSAPFIENHKEIPWRQVKGMRDRIGHGYGTIDIDIVWFTAMCNIKELYEFCEKTINNIAGTMA